MASRARGVEPGSHRVHVVADGHRMGCQFHPERSAAAGQRILQNFLELPA